MPAGSAPDERTAGEIADRIGSDRVECRTERLTVRDLPGDGVTSRTSRLVATGSRRRIVRCVPTEFTAPDVIFAERLNPVASVVDHVPKRGSRIGVDVDVLELPLPWADPVALDGTRLPD